MRHSWTVNEGSERRRALLVEDHAPLRIMLQAVLADSDFEVLAVNNARMALRSFDRFDPDLLVADVELGERPNGIELAEILRSQAPYLGVVFITDYPATRVDAMTRAALHGSAFVDKGAIESMAVIVDAAESALDDGQTPVVVLSSATDPRIRALTHDQLDLLRLIAIGYSNATIAQVRGCTIRGVERLVNRTFAALGLKETTNSNSRVLATRMYIQAFGLPSADAAN